MRIRKILNNAPKTDKDVYVFRGNQTRHGNLFKAGIQRFKSFQSYSFDPTEARRFAGGWMSRITILKGTPVLDLTSISKHEEEKEVLLPDGGLYMNTYTCKNSKLVKFNGYYTKFGVYLWSKKTSAQNSNLINNKIFKGLSPKSVMKNSPGTSFYKESPKNTSNVTRMRLTMPTKPSATSKSKTTSRRKST